VSEVTLKSYRVPNDVAVLTGLCGLETPNPAASEPDAAGVGVCSTLERCVASDHSGVQALNPAASKP